MKNDLQKIVQEMSFLYELSLTIGQTLDFEKNCELFLHKLMSYKGLGYASLWLKESVYSSGTIGENYVLLFAHPIVYTKKIYLKSSEQVFKCVDENTDVQTVTSDQKEYKTLIWEQGLEKGTFTIFPLGELGFLKVYSFNKDPNLFTLREFNQLSKVINKFSISLKGCLAHKKLKDEITERERIEEKLKVAKETAETNNKLKSEFLANISHELRTPINAIIGFSDLVLDSELVDEQREHLMYVKSSSNSLLEMVNDILDFSKIEAKKFNLEKNLFNLHELITHIMKSFLPKVLEKRIELICDIEDNVPVLVKGDGPKLKQILLNVIGNAIKFTEEGEVFVRIKSQLVCDQKIKIMFEVHDTGIGIPENHKLSIFSPFVQVDGSSTRKYGGTGLGLSISKHLIEMMDGRIWLDSKLHEGSTFYFTVFVEESEGNLKVKNKGEKLARPKQNKVILLVEDNIVNQKLTCKVLEKLGYQVVTAENGNIAIQQWYKNSIDLILMDVQMPEMDGIEATKVIRDMENKSGNEKLVPIIALTAHALKGDAQRVLNAGMTDYLAKPLNVLELAKKLKVHL